MNSPIAETLTAELASAETAALAERSSIPSPDASDALSASKDDFCVRYAHLIEECGEPIQYTEKGGIVLNEMLFAAKFAQDNKVLFSPEENQFYAYEAATGLWRRMSDARICLQIHRDAFAAAKREGIHELSFKLTDQRLKSLSSLVVGIAEKHDAFGVDHGLIHATNGMLRLSSGTAELLPFSADYHSRNMVPFAYKADAKCERFINDLLKPALSDEDIDLLQRWTGSVLLGRNQAQRIMLITGLAGGGKSTLVSVLESIIGAQNIAELRVDQLAQSRFEKARFIGKTMLVGKDVRSDYLGDRAVSHLKSLTGGDRMTAELKGSNEVMSIRGEFAVAITCNAAPRLRLDDDADAWRRRLLMLIFNGKKPAKPIADFAGYLVKNEGDGIFAWMVAGAIKHLAELETVGGYIFTGEQQGRIDSMLAESNSVEEFVKASVIAKKGGIVTGDELLAAYEIYCSKQDWTPRSGQAFRATIKQVLLERFKVTQSHDIPRFGSHVRGYRGVSIYREELDPVGFGKPNQSSQSDDLEF